MNTKTPVVWTNDDILYGRSAELRRQLEFLDRHGIPGVFFVIPRCIGHGDLDQDKELLSLIESARNKGHEFYQHGFIHSAFECGIPNLAMFNLDARAAALFDTDRDHVESLHTLEALVEMLENGQKIWRRAFGEDSVGFRPGWGSYCGNLYKALHVLGYQWISSQIPSMTCYLQRYGQDIAFLEPQSPEATLQFGPHKLRQGVWEFPIGPEVAWRVPNDPAKMSAMVDLGMRHFEALRNRNEPMLMVSHHHGLSFSGEVEGCPPLDSGTGYAVHDKFLPKLLASGNAEFMGMKELAARYIPADHNA